MENVLLWVKVKEVEGRGGGKSLENTVLVKAFKRNLMQFTFFPSDTYAMLV